MPRFLFRLVKDMPFHPRHHAEHDLFVIFFQRQRMPVAIDASFWQYIHGHIATEHGHFLLKFARGIDAILGVIADNDDDRHTGRAGFSVNCMGNRLAG
jgi:hypothetical protein